MGLKVTKTDLGRPGFKLQRAGVALGLHAPTRGTRISAGLALSGNECLRVAAMRYQVQSKNWRLILSRQSCRESCASPTKKEGAAASVAVSDEKAECLSSSTRAVYGGLSGCVGGVYGSSFQSSARASLDSGGGFYCIPYVHLADSPEYLPANACLLVPSLPSSSCSSFSSSFLQYPSARPSNLYSHQPGENAVLLLIRHPPNCVTRRASHSTETACS
ncbi:hypothetical protein R3P38DRAFT_1769851 [Favolaschia claudopus]|uniref:Uncharacterized protein n=1 Tax=Favolaschia claudopus TaxID=2862362 RepID=A0AAW0A820_9AGAR